MLSSIPLTFGCMMIGWALLAALFGARLHVQLGRTGVLYGVVIAFWSVLWASPELHGVLGRYRRVASYATMALFLSPYMAIAGHTVNSRGTHAL